MKELYSDKLSDVQGACEDVFKKNLGYIAEWAKQTRKCVAFANGDQLYNFTVGSGISVNHQPPVKKDSRDPKGYVSSEIEPIIRTLSSYMTRAKPGTDITSLSRDDSSKNVAKVAEKIMDAKYDLDQELDSSVSASYWSLVTGTVFSKDYWDMSKGQYVAQIDANGNIVTDPETGETIYSEKSGNNAVSMLSGLSMILDNSVTEPRNLPYIGDMYVCDVDWAKEMFDKNLPGYTGKITSISEDNNLADSMQILETMKFSVPYLSKGIQDSSSGKCLIRELYLQPTKAFQKGRSLIMAGSEIVYITSPEMGSTYYMELETTEWHPYEMFRYEIYLGRLLGKGLVEQLIPLQMRLNEINKAILINANTIARPRLMCTSEQIPNGTLAGDKAILRYSAFPGIREPYILQGSPLPEQFFKERQTIIDEMVRIAGTNFIMQGQPPTGVTAASAIAQLLENSNTQFSGIMASWEKFHERRYTKKLRLLHKFNMYPDRELNRYVKTLMKDALDTEVRDFVGQKDLSDGVVLKVAVGSMTPKSEAVKRDLYKQLAKDGLLGPVGEDSPKGAELREQLLEKFGEKGLETLENVHVKKARWENDRVSQSKTIDIDPLDNDPIHIEIHTSKLLDPLFLENATPQMIQIERDHIAKHNQQAAQKQPPAPPPPPPKLSLSLKADATSQEIEQLAGFPPIPPQSPPGIGMPPSGSGGPAGPVPMPPQGASAVGQAA